MRTRPFATLLGVTLSALAAPVVRADPEIRQISFSEAIRLALVGNAEVRLARDGLDAARARVDAAEAARLPKLRAEANAFVWDDELVIEGLPLPPGIDPPDVRDQFTANATVSIVQPLSPLYPLGQLVALERAGLRAARAEVDRARLDAAFRAAESYLRLLEGTALREVAAQAVAQLDAHLERARKLEQAGVLGQVDVLRIQAERDSARQGLLRAEAGVAIAERALVLVLGLPPETQLVAADTLPTSPPPIRWTAEQAVAAAFAARPELAAARERVVQAERGRKAAWSKHFPQVAAIATYQHTEGQGSFAKENQFFGGLTLTWDVWEWGKTRAEVREASARERQARTALDAQRDAVAFEVRRRHAEASAAWQALELAQTGLSAAEEAYRIQTVRFEQGAATTTDVLDAASQVSRARAQVASARYGYYVALVALARAVGEMPG